MKSSTLNQYLNMLPDSSDEVVIPHILDLETYFNTIKEPIIINKIPLKTNHMDDILSHIANTATSDDLLSSCKCGELRGKYYEGVICKECSAEVTSNLVTNLANEVWITIPEEIGKVPNPLIFLIMSGCLKKGNSSTESYIDYIIDVNKEYPDDLKGVFQGQGFKYFYNNFDFIINYFIHTYPKTKKRKNIILLKILLEKYRNILFTDRLPIMSKFVQPISTVGFSRRYADAALTEIIKSVISLILNKYYDILTGKLETKLEQSVARTYYRYIDYTHHIIKNKLSKKKAYLRQNVFGTKTHFTFRNVIVPITTEHVGDEVYIPWKTALNVYMYHLLNMFTKRLKYTLTEAHNTILDAYYNYSPIIDQLFQLLILEGKYKGLPVIINRNPTLLPSGLYLGFIMKVKEEIIHISETFIKNFGRIPKDKKISTDLSYGEDEIYITRKRIIKGSNKFDTPEAIEKYKNKELIFKPTKASETGIADKSYSVSYVPAKLVNLDFDGDNLDNQVILETTLTDEVVKRIHPSSFFIGNGSMGIGGKVLLPRHNIILLNSWLANKK